MQHRPLAQRRAGIPRFVWSRRIYLGWWITGVLALVSFSRVGFFNPVLGIFIDPLEDEFGWSRTTIAGALSVGTIVAAFSSPFLGQFIDRFGGRYFIAGSMIMSGILLILLAMMQEVWQFYLLFGLGRALAVGILEIAVTVTVANWFIRNRGRAMGLTLVGTRGAMALMPLIVLLASTLFDWRAAFVALGVIVLVISVGPTWLLVRRRPEDVGLLPDGDPTPVIPPAAAGSVTADSGDVRWTVREIIRTRAFWLLLFGTSQLMFVGGAVNLTIPSHLEDNGIGRSTAVTVVTVWAICGIIGGFVGGEIRQHISVRFALPLILCFTSTSLIWLILVDKVWMAYLFAVWHGFAFGAQLPLNQISFPDYFGRWSIGTLRGITAPVQFGLNALGPLFAGLVFDSRGTYDPIFAVFAGLLVFGAVLIFLAVPPIKPTLATQTQDPPTARPDG